MPETRTELLLTLSERHTADFEMIANGGFAPLRGFQGSEDWARVTEEMRLASGGGYWPIPITLATGLDCSVGDVVELASDEGKPLGRLTVEEVFERDGRREAERVYGTTDSDHPGVAAIYEEGDRCIAGAIEADALPDHEEAFMRRYLTPEESRRAFAERGWKKVVAFQTRNPIHRAHEYITKAALEICDGLMIHPLVGATKSDDIPAEVRMRCYETLLASYYPKERALLSIS
jgi:sulfate adenylyltransferase